MPNWSLYCCWICWSRSCSAWFTALSSCATRLSPLPCGSALSSWVLSCLGISRSRSGVSIVTALAPPRCRRRLRAAPWQQTLAQHPADVLRLGLSHNLAGELVVSLPSYQRKSSLSMLLLPRFSLLPLGDTIENEYEKTNSLSRCDIRLTSSCHLWRRTGRIFDAELLRRLVFSGPTNSIQERSGPLLQALDRAQMPASTLRGQA